MTITHLSHLDLTKIGETRDSILFEGSLAACRRMAFAHGMEVEKYEGATVGMDGSRAFTIPADANSFVWCFFRGGGFIQRGRDNYCLLIPMAVWLEN